MKKFLPFTSIAFICLAGFIFLRNISTTAPLFSDTEMEGQMEHAKKKQWIQNMLADPATGKIPEGSRLKELAFLRQLHEVYPYADRSRSSWKFRGPSNVGGRTRAVAIDINNEEHILAGSVSGGIWQTLDGGDTWQRVTVPNDHPGVVSICQDTRPGKTNIWYALSGELIGTSASGGSGASFYFGDGAMVSTDHGHTFKPIASTAIGVPGVFSSVFQGGWRIVSSPVVDSNKTCIYMATYGTIFRSVDTGKTWQAVLGSGNDSYYTDVAVSSNGVVYAVLSWDGNTKGIYRSADGVTFTNITPSYVKNLNRTVLDINPNNENEVYFLSEIEKDSSFGATTYNYEGTPEYVSLLKYTYKSGDGSDAGGEWTNLSQNLPVNDPDQFDKFNCQGGYDLVVRVQPQTNHVIIGGTNLYISTDGFTTPNHTSQFGGYAIATRLDGFGVYPNHHPDQHDILFYRSNSKKVLSASDGGVKITQNVNASEVVWEEKSIGYNTSQIYTVTIDPVNAYDQWLLAGLQDNGNYLTRTTQVKQPWNMTINGDGAYNYIAPDKSFCVISTQLGNVRKVVLDENGQVLKRMRIDPDGYDKSLYGFINCIDVDPNNDNILYMPIGKKLGVLNNLRDLPVVNSSSKLKGHWILSDSIQTANISNTNPSEITVVAVSKNPANVVYVGTNNREVYRVNNPLSNNPTLTKLDLKRLPTSGYVSDICIDPDDANRFFVVYSNYNATSVLFTNNGGINWYFAGGNLETANNPTGANPSVRCMAILKQADGHKTYFLGTSIGLFSTDSIKIDTIGSSNPTVWKQESPELIGANIVTDIKVRNTDGYIAVGTHGNGIFETYYTGNKPPASNIITTSSVVYPNPTTGDFYLQFQTTKDVLASAYLMDMTGRKLRLLFSDFYMGGKFSVRVNLQDYPAGRYMVLYYPSTDSKPEVHNIIKL